MSLYDSFMESVGEQIQDESFSSLFLKACLAAYVLNVCVGVLLAPAHRPPFYYELPYIPWLGSLVQFAVNPRNLIERATVYVQTQYHKQCFTVHLFGTPMTFLTGSEGHAHFFKQREHVFDIREAYAMTVITFGPGVCYDCPQKKMAEQFAYVSVIILLFVLDGILYWIPRMMLSLLLLLSSVFETFAQH